MSCTDIDYIWQCRMHSGFHCHQKLVPFPDCSEVGLDFNVACRRKDKLNLSLLTNGVVLEVYAFAKAVTKALKYLLSDILEFNFDIGIENRQQRYIFANRVHNKILLGKKSQLGAVFLLPGTKLSKQSAKSEVLRVPPYANLGELFEKSQPADRNRLAKKDITDSEPVTADDNGGINTTVRADEWVKELAVKGLYPRCEEIGLDLDIRPKNTPKQKLEASLLTRGVILEVLKFVKVLCGKPRQIVLDVLEHNFDFNAYESHVWFRITQIVNKKPSFAKVEIKEAFRKERCIFVQSTYHFKWKKRWVEDYDNKASAPAPPAKRKRKSKYNDDASSSGFEFGDRDLVYPGQIDTSEFALRMQTGAQADTFRCPVWPWSDLRVKHAVPLSGSVDADAMSDLFSEDVNSGMKVDTEKLLLWKQRAVRSKQIVECRANSTLTCCRSLGLDFNVGSGVKRNLEIELLTNRALYEVFIFASDMTKGQNMFTLWILEKNFSINVQDVMHQRNFLLHIIRKTKHLLNHPTRNDPEFLNRAVGFPEVFNMVDVIGTLPPPETVTPHSAAADGPSMELYPFCLKLGLNLWTVEERSLHEKLDLCLLTNGTLLEVNRFAKELCGTVWKTMCDVLEHNFNIDPQSGETANAIQMWCIVQSRLKAKRHKRTSKELLNWFAKIVQACPTSTFIPKEFKCHSPAGNATNISDISHSGQDRKDVLASELDQEKVSDIDNYPLCKEMRLDLEINSKMEARAKLDFQVLTRAVLYEIHRYVEGRCHSQAHYVPTLYKILEHNFDLGSQLHRPWEFALSVASQVKTIVGKFGRSHSKKGDYPNKVFELPFEVPSVCKEEPEDECGQVENDDNDVQFVRQLIPIDIEVELE